MTPDRTVTFSISGQSWSVITGSDLYQNPERYTSADDPDYAATVRAGQYLRNGRSRRAGKGWSHIVVADPAAAGVIAEYCETVGQTFVGGCDMPEDRADGRALLATAARIRARLAA